MSLDENDREIIRFEVRNGVSEAMTPMWENHHAADKRLTILESDAAGGTVAQTKQGERLGAVEIGFEVLKAKLSAHSKWILAIGGVALTVAGYIVRTWIQVKK